MPASKPPSAAGSTVHGPVEPKPAKPAKAKPKVVARAGGYVVYDDDLGWVPEGD